MELARCYPALGIRCCVLYTPVRFNRALASTMPHGGGRYCSSTALRRLRRSLTSTSAAILKCLKLNGFLQWLKGRIQQCSLKSSYSIIFVLPTSCAGPHNGPFTVAEAEMSSLYSLPACDIFFPALHHSAIYVARLRLSYFPPQPFSSLTLLAWGSPMPWISLRPTWPHWELT